MVELSSYIISPQAAMQEVLAVIDRGAAQIALVTDEDRRLLGTITDGDFRRALLRGFPMTTCAEEVMHRGFRFLPATATDEEAVNLMRREVIHQIPALDDAGRVVHLFRLEELI